MSLQNQIIDILSQVLELKPEAAARLNHDSPLLGAVPEFDSMAVVTIITALEERFGFIVEDDEIDAPVFETVGTLINFVEQKLA